MMLSIESSKHNICYSNSYNPIVSIKQTYFETERRNGLRKSLFKARQPSASRQRAPQGCPAVRLQHVREELRSTRLPRQTSQSSRSGESEPKIDLKYDGIYQVCDVNIVYLSLFVFKLEDV